MKKGSYLLIISLFTLSSAVCRAEGEPLIHNFPDMSGNGTLTWPVNYKTGVTADVTYTCTGTAATFGTYTYNSTQYVTLNMSKSDDIITLSPALEGLTKFEIYFYPDATRETIEVYVSKDGVDWGEAITGDNRVDSKNMIRIKDLPRNNYYIQLRNKTNTAVSIHELRYYQSSCRCLRVVIN